MAKVKCIITRPDEQYGHVTNISVTLENLQKTVGGYIEAVTLAPDIGVIMLVNEEGKLKNMEFNFHCGIDTIVGPAIIIGQKGENFGDIPIDLATWKKLLHSWGN